MKTSKFGCRHLPKQPGVVATACDRDVETSGCWEAAGLPAWPCRKGPGPRESTCLKTKHLLRNDTEDGSLAPTCICPCGYLHTPVNLYLKHITHTHQQNNRIWLSNMGALSKVQRGEMVMNSFSITWSSLLNL